MDTDDATRPRPTLPPPTLTVAGVPAPAWMELYEDAPGASRYLGQVASLDEARAYCARYLPDRRFLLLLRSGPAARIFLELRLTPSFGREPTCRLLYAAEEGG